MVQLERDIKYIVQIERYYYGVTIKFLLQIDGFDVELMTYFYTSNWGRIGRMVLYDDEMEHPGSYKILDKLHWALNRDMNAGLVDAKKKTTTRRTLNWDKLRDRNNGKFSSSVTPLKPIHSIYFSRYSHSPDAATTQINLMNCGANLQSWMDWIDFHSSSRALLE